jgi:hypothetical protein
MVGDALGDEVLDAGDGCLLAAGWGTLVMSPPVFSAGAGQRRRSQPEPADKTVMRPGSLGEEQAEGRDEGQDLRQHIQRDGDRGGVTRP